MPDDVPLIMRAGDALELVWKEQVQQNVAQLSSFGDHKLIQPLGKPPRIVHNAHLLGLRTSFPIAHRGDEKDELTPSVRLIRCSRVADTPIEYRAQQISIRW